MKNRSSTNSITPIISFASWFLFLFLFVLGCFKEEPAIPTRIFNKSTWTPKLNFGYDLAFPTCFSIGQKGYMYSGLKSEVDQGFLDYSYTRDFWEYDPKSDTWTQKADFAGFPRAEAVGFCINDKGYMGTGYGIVDTFGMPDTLKFDYLNDFWEYDPLTNLWKKRKNFPGKKRSNAVGFSVGTKGYIGLGDYYDDIWEYGPNDDWVEKSRLHDLNDPEIEYLQYATCFVIGNKAYIGTGETDFDISNVFIEFDPSENKWTRKADFSGDARVFAIGFSINDKGYIGLGTDDSDFVGDSFFTDIWKYDPINNKWEQSDEYPGDGRVGLIKFVFKDKAYLGCGSVDGNDAFLDANYSSDFWEYSVK